MKRTLLAMLLALPALALSSSDAAAQCSPLGGPCFRIFGGMHQHGPLYNYGPYAGYYPFAPYGPWDSNLNYTGPRPGDQAACGRGGCGRGGHGGGGAPVRRQPFSIAPTAFGPMSAYPTLSPVWSATASRD